jgi:hypothetical protein
MLPCVPKIRGVVTTGAALPTGLAKAERDTMNLGAGARPLYARTQTRSLVDQRLAP